MFEKSLTDLVKGIRAHKHNEEAYIRTAINEIRNELKANDIKKKAVAIQKLTYVSRRWQNILFFFISKIFLFFFYSHFPFFYNSCTCLVMIWNGLLSTPWRSCLTQASLWREQVTLLQVKVSQRTLMSWFWLLKHSEEFVFQCWLFCTLFFSCVVVTCF